MAARGGTTPTVPSTSSDLRGTKDMSTVRTSTADMRGTAVADRAEASKASAVFRAEAVGTADAAVAAVGLSAETYGRRR